MTASLLRRGPAHHWVGRRVLLIGSSGAAYEALAAQLASWGACVVLAGEDAEACTALADRLAAGGEEVLSVPSGSSGPRSRKAALGLVRSLVGEVEAILFHLAPWVSQGGPADEASASASGLPATTSAGDPLEEALAEGVQLLFEVLVATMPDLHAAEDPRIFAWWQPVAASRADDPDAILDGTVHAALEGLLRSVATEFSPESEAGIHGLAVAPSRMGDGLEQLALLGGPAGRSLEARTHRFEALDRPSLTEPS